MPEFPCGRGWTLVVRCLYDNASGERTAVSGFADGSVLLHVEHVATPLGGFYRLLIAVPLA